MLGAQVKWPSSIKTFLGYLSVFNFNLDLTAPECSIPNVSFANKWQFTMAIPVVAVTFFAVTHVVLLFKKRCILGRKSKLFTHVDAMIGTFLTMM